MEKTMNHFEEIGAKIEEKVDEAISKKLESLELIQSITKIILQEIKCLEMHQI